MFDNVVNLLSSNGEIKDKSFVVSRNAIYFESGALVYPFSNVTRFGSYRVNKNPAPIIIAGVAGLFGLSLLLSGSLTLAVVGVALALGAAWFIRKELKSKKYAFGIKTSSGEERYIISTSGKSIQKVIDTVAAVIEAGSEKVRYEINMKNVEIKELSASQVVDRSVKNEGIIGGSVTTGEEA